MPIHSAAIVDSAAEIAEDAEIGPFCVVAADVRIGARTRLMAHVYVEGATVIGEDNTFYPYSTVGVAPQDLKYRGEPSCTEIGNGNRIREFVTIHRGTEGGRLVTRLGNNNLLMAYTHVAHDAQIGSHTVLANGTTLAGHVEIGDWAVIGAFTGVHQYCRVGRHSMIGGYSVVVQDVLPFSTTVSTREIKTFGANKLGLERRGYPAEVIDSLQKAFRLLTRAGLNTSQAVVRIREEVTGSSDLDELIAFIESSARGFIK